MKKIAILLSVFFISFSQAQKPINQNLDQKKEHKKSIKENPDARIFAVNNQKEVLLSRKYVMTKEETLKNKKGYKRVHTALNKEMKAEKRKERKKLRIQNRILNKYIKQSNKKIKKESKQTLKPD